MEKGFVEGPAQICEYKELEAVQQQQKYMRLTISDEEIGEACEVILEAVG